MARSEVRSSRRGPAPRLAPVAAAALIAACSSAGNSSETRLSVKEIAQGSKPAIVQIRGGTGEPQSGGVGTGFIVSPDGRIATNLHVIQGSREITVKMLDGTERPVRRVIAADPQHDLAIVQIDAEELPTLDLGDSDQVAAGDPVIAIGNPLGVLDYTVSDGLISSVRSLDSLEVLQISAPISRGSSGGPLFNRKGEVIGVATAIAMQGQNLNFGVPSNYLRPLLSASGGLSLEEFAERYGDAPDAAPESSPVDIERKVPVHDVSVLQGCSEESLAELMRVISRAIDVGAPLYNRGEHEACYRIYESAASELEQSLSCGDVSKALGDGLLRASTLDSYTAKAWALRDAFDGLIDVVMRKTGQR